MPKTSPVRLRLAPSPTGFLHIGNLRTLLYDDFFTRAHDGTLILRIEDTDQSRKVDGAVEHLLDMLHVMGITPDEGPRRNSDGEIIEVGDYGPYTQSERLPLYAEHAQKLITQGDAYYCFCTSERLDTMRKQQQAQKRPPMYDRTCHAHAPEEVQRRRDAGEKCVVRMLVPRGQEIIVHDLVRGDVTFKTDTIDDQVIMKSDGFPTYHLAVVVDDHLMEISHNFRGEEWLPSTPKHILLYKAFGWNAPAFAHLPLLINADKSKLSKRQGDVSVEDFLAKGYLPEALINFIAFLGWHPGSGETREIYSYEELAKVFEISKVHKAGAVVDSQKLDKINAHYIREHAPASLLACPTFDLAQHLTHVHLEVPTYSGVPEDFLLRVMSVEQERLEKLSDFGVHNDFLFKELLVDEALLAWKDATPEETLTALTHAQSTLAAIDDNLWTREHLTKVLMDAAGDDRGAFLWPLRAAITGQKRSPSPIDCAWIFGKEETLRRLAIAQQTLTH